MLRWTLQRMLLFLWMTRVTLQGGTGYKPQNANGGAAQMPPRGQSDSPPVANAHGAQFKGYGTSAAAAQNAYGAKSDGNAYAGKNYGAVPAGSHGQGAKPNGYPANKGTGAYGTKPNKPIYGGRPPYGGIGMGMGMMNQHAVKQRGGYGNGNGYGYRALSYGGPSNLMGTHPQNGAGVGYNVPAGYPNSGAAKALKPGYGGYPTGGAAKGPNAGSSLGYMGYPSGGAKGPKPGYGAKAGTSDGQRAKPNGYGVSGGMSKGPYTKAANSGYVPMTNGKGGVSSSKGSKGHTFNPEASSRLPVTSNTKGVSLPFIEREPRTGLPLAPKPTQGLPPVLQQMKGPRSPLPQGKAPKPVAAQLAPVASIPQGKGPKPFWQGPASYKPAKAYKPVAPAPVVPQSKAPKPFAPIVLHGEALAAPESAHFPQGKAPKPFPQAPLALEQVIPQELNFRPAEPQPMTPHAGISSPESLVPIPQFKAPKPAVPQPISETQQTKIPPALQPNPALPQLNKPTTNNPGLGAGMGGYPVPGMNNGYKGVFGAGQGSYPSAEYANGYGNAVPQGGQQAALGSKGKSQNKYGIGGLSFGGSPNGYQTNPSGKYGNGAKPYNPKAAGKYGYGSVPYNPQSLGLESVAKSPGFGGLPYSGQPTGYGLGGLPYGGQPFGLSPDAKSGKYGSPESMYNPESVNLGGSAKPAKYGNPAVPYDFLGTVTDGQSVDERRSLEVLHEGPVIDGQKSIDQFGDGDIPPQPDAPVILGTGEGNAKSTDKYRTNDYIDGRIQAEVVSFPANPTEGPAPHIPAVTLLDSSLSPDGSSLAPVSVPIVSAGPLDGVPEGPGSPVPPQHELPTLMLQPAPPQQIHIQQHLKVHFQPHDSSHTGKEGKYELNGFFGNKHRG
ncbi:calymmin [Myxocyprinus asiaticus]|uniref:calymmin n=1 Tax=Myxocyprinus asiaticus TaxID=70543 RepID=UPI00222241BD|nr:calymmin [Myxocyprinus asiaticus]